MKTCNLLLMSVLIWTASIGKSLDLKITEMIRQYMQAGQAHQLADLFDKKIELVIETEDVDFPSVSASHAELILKSFFRKYPPRKFQYIYQGNTSRLRYSTAIYQSNGESFSIYVLMRQGTQGQFVINTLHVRKS